MHHYSCFLLSLSLFLTRSLFALLSELITNHYIHAIDRINGTRHRFFGRLLDSKWSIDQKIDLRRNNCFFCIISIHSKSANLTAQSCVLLTLLVRLLKHSRFLYPSASKQPPILIIRLIDISLINLTLSTSSRSLILGISLINVTPLDPGKLTPICDKD